MKPHIDPTGYAESRVREDDAMTSEKPALPSDTDAVLTVRVERDALDGGFVVSADEAPGCMSQGETITAALENFADAFTDWAIARAMRGMSVPTLTAVPAGNDGPSNG